MFDGVSPGSGGGIIESGLIYNTHLPLQAAGDVGVLGCFIGFGGKKQRRPAVQRGVALSDADMIQYHHILQISGCHIIFNFH